MSSAESSVERRGHSSATRLRLRARKCCASGDPGDRAGPCRRLERYLTRLTRVGLEMMLEFGNPDFPVFYQASNTTLKIGGDNPDNVYWNATIAGDRDYRLRGTRGTVRYPVLCHQGESLRH